jgi:hypothetical protein
VSPWTTVPSARPGSKGYDHSSPPQPARAPTALTSRPLFRTTQDGRVDALRVDVVGDALPDLQLGVAAEGDANQVRVLQHARGDGVGLRGGLRGGRGQVPNMQCSKHFRLHPLSGGRSWLLYLVLPCSSWGRYYSASPAASAKASETYGGTPSAPPPPPMPLSAASLRWGYGDSGAATATAMSMSASARPSGGGRIAPPSLEEAKVEYALSTPYIGPLSAPYLGPI